MVLGLQAGQEKASHRPGVAVVPEQDSRSDAGTESSPSLLVGLCQSSAVFAFARSPAAGHVKTEKLNSRAEAPQDTGC